MSERSQCMTLGLEPSFGFGDRIGLATPGHVEAMKRSGSGIAPIFAQQSIREMVRTQRTAKQVMADALHGAMSAGWEGCIGADADHLKTREDVDVTIAAGFTFFTIDPSDEVDQKADDYDFEILQSKFDAIYESVPWYDVYVGKCINLMTGTLVELNKEVCMRAAVKYGAAIRKALYLGRYIRDVHDAMGLDYEIELSVDETAQPTTLAEHYIIADQCFKGGMNLVSLAPRFVGEFEKGIDYKGDVELLEASLNDHAELAELLGPYKLSLHSGSDKLSMYTALARATKGRFHVKTAGTSYLEALRVVARHDSTLFRRIVRFARDRYNAERASYHVSATNESVPSDNCLTETQLEQVYLECWSAVPQGTGFTEPGRQILHCTFGSTLTHSELGVGLRSVLEAHADVYTEVLADHFSRHLEALLAGI